MQKQISRFIELLAKRLHAQLSARDEDEALSSSSTTLQRLVQSSIQDLPPTSLRQALIEEERLTQLLSLLRQEIQALRRRSGSCELRPEEEKKIILLTEKGFTNAVKESVDEFLESFRDGTLDSCKLRLVLGRLLQANEEPPLELLWSFVAVNLKQTNPITNSTSNGVQNRISVAKDLFRCLTAFSVGQSCSAFTAIGALVPVIAILSKAAAELSVNPENRVSRKTEKILLQNLKDAVGEMLSYIAVCGSKSAHPFSPKDTEGSLSKCMPCCIALLNSLSSQQPEQDLELSFERDMEDVFPLTSAVIREALLKENCSVEYLASVVILEASLLRLVLELLDWRRMSKHREEGSKAKEDEIRRNLKVLAVNGIAATRNQDFFDILLELLLEPNLPVVSLLNEKEEILLRGVLYEAASLVNYAFLKQNTEDQTDAALEKSNRFFLNRLIVANRAVQLFRSVGERSWAISFSKAFSNVPIPSELTKWLSSQKAILKFGEAVKTPQALLGCLVNLEDQQRLKLILNKHPVFDINKLSAEKALLNGGPKGSNVDMSSKLKNVEGIKDDLFYVDTNGETDAGKEDEDSAGKAFAVAAESMRVTGNGERKESKWKRQTRFQRQIQHDGSAKENTRLDLDSDLSMSEESDVESAGFRLKKSKIETESPV